MGNEKGRNLKNQIYMFEDAFGCIVRVGFIVVTPLLDICINRRISFSQISFPLCRGGDK